MRVIDLSMEIMDSMEVYPGDPKVSINTHNSIESDGYNLSKITMGTHTGTHVDAFYHMDNDGLMLDEIELTRFMGRAIIIDSLDELEALTQRYGNIDAQKVFDGILISFHADVELSEYIERLNIGFFGGDMSEDLERRLLTHGIITYTDLVNLESLPRDEVFIFVGLPLKIKRGDGSPVRAAAVIGLK